MITGETSRKSVTVIWLSIIVISVTYIWQNLSLVSDMQQFMPNNSSDKRLQILLRETHKGMAANLILAQLEGAAPDDLATLSQRLKSSLMNQKDKFLSVNNGDQQWDLGPYRTIIEHRYLLNQPGDFSAAGLRKEFEDILTLLREGISGDYLDYLLADPQKTFIKYLLSQSGQVQPEKYRGVWFVEDKLKAVLMIQLKSSGFDLDRLEDSLNIIKKIATELDDTGEIKLTLTGPGAIAVSTRDAIQRTTKIVSWVLTGVVLLLFWIGYRSIGLAFIAGIPMLTSIIVAIAITLIFFGEVHGIVLAFGITMLGVCLDYPLHLFSHLNKDESPVSTLKKIWPTLSIGVLTTVFAYLTLMGTGFSGLTQLAVFSATGLIVALAVTRWFIPVWVSTNNADKRHVLIRQPISNQAKLTVSIFVISVSLSFLLAHDNIFSTDIAQISATPAGEVELDRKLRKALHAPDVSHVFIADGRSISDVLVRAEKVKKALEPAIDKGLISGVHTASDILPDKAQQKYYQSLLPDTKTLRINVEKATSDLAFKNNAFDGFIEAVASSKSRQPVEYETILTSPLAGKLQSMLFEKNGNWYTLIRLTGVNNESEFTSWLEGAEDINPYYLSMRDATSVLMNQYLESAWARLLAIISLVVLVILWLFRKRKASGWIIIPVISGVIVSLAVQVMLGNLINIFHVLSLLLVIGMGLDYSLFFNRDWDKESQLQDRTHAIIISAITTIVAFATLGLSEIPILAAMGQTVSVGILTCFITSQYVAVPKRIRSDNSIA